MSSLKWSYSFFSSKGGKPQLKKLWNEYLKTKIISATNDNENEKDEKNNSGHSIDEILQEYELLILFLDALMIESEIVKQEIKLIVNNNDVIDLKTLLNLCDNVRIIQSDELHDIIESVFHSLLEFIVIAINMNEIDLYDLKPNIIQNLDIKDITKDDKKRRSIEKEKEKEKEKTNVLELLILSIMVLYSISSDKSPLRSRIFFLIENEQNNEIVNNLMKTIIVTKYSSNLSLALMLNLINGYIGNPNISLALIKANIVNHLFSIYECNTDSLLSLMVVDLIKTMLPQYRSFTQTEDTQKVDDSIDIEGESNIITYKGIQKTYKSIGHLPYQRKRIKQIPKSQGNAQKTLTERGFSLAFNMMNELLRLTPWTTIDETEKEITDVGDVYNSVDVERRAIPLEILMVESADYLNHFQFTYEGNDVRILDIDSKSANSLMTSILESVVDYNSLLETLTIICDILLANKVLQKEFNNYHKICEVIIKVDNKCKLEPDNCQHISRKILSIVTNSFSICQGSIVSNMYSMVILKNLVESDSYTLFLMVVRAINSLLQANPINVIAVEESKVIYSLTEKMVFFISDPKCIIKEFFDLELVVEIVSILQMASVATSYRDSDIIEWFCQIILNVSFSNQYEYSHNSTTDSQRCSNCEMENATFECIHDTCIKDRCIGLCFECDKVFHKASAKRSHIRLPSIKGRLNACMEKFRHSPIRHVCILPELSNNNFQRNNQEILLLIFISGLSGLLDDRASRNQDFVPSILESILLAFRRIVVLPISSESINIFRFRKIAQMLDPMNNIFGEEFTLGISDLLNGVMIRRMVISSLVVLLSRTIFPYLHIPFFINDVDTTKKRIDISHVISNFRSYGGDALLAHLLLNKAPTDEFSTQSILMDSEKQLIIWLLRELLVTAIEVNQDHAEGIIGWVVWLLNCTSENSKGITSKSAILPKFAPGDQYVNNIESKLHEFAIVPIGHNFISKLTKFHLLQELQLLFAGEDFDPGELIFCRAKNMSIVSLNNIGKSSRNHSFEFFTRDEISKTTSRDPDTSVTSVSHKTNGRKVEFNNANSLPAFLYRTPCICSCVQALFNKSNSIQVLLHLVIGDLCDNSVLGFLINDFNSSKNFEALSEMDIEIWWQSLTLLIRLLCNNDNGKSIVDKYIGIQVLIKSLLPLTEPVFQSDDSSNSSVFIKNEMSGAVTQFLIELCVCKGRIFTPMKPFIALTIHKLTDKMDEDSEKYSRSSLALISRPILSSYRVYTDLIDKLDETGSANSLLYLSPIYYSEERFLKVINDIIRPKPLLFDYQNNFCTSQDIKISSQSFLNNQSSLRKSYTLIESKDTLTGELGEGSNAGSHNGNSVRYQKSFNSILTLNSTSSIQLINDNDSVSAWENESQGHNSHHSLLTLGQILMPTNTPPGSTVEESKEYHKFGLYGNDNYENASMTSESGLKSMERTQINSSTAYFPLFDILDTYHETSAATLLTMISEIMSVRAGLIFNADSKFNTFLAKTAANELPVKSSSSENGPSNDFIQIALKRQLLALLPSNKERKGNINWQPNYSRIVFRSIEHGQLLLTISLITKGDSKNLASYMLSHLLDGNPHNSELLFSSSYSTSAIIELLPYLDEKSRDSMTYLLAQIFSHNAHENLLLQLIKRAYKVTESNREYLENEKLLHENEKKMPDLSRQLLQIVQQAVIKKTPSRYIHFDNSNPFKSRIMLPSLEKIPNSKSGLTVVSWLRLGSVGQCPTSSLYQMALTNASNFIVNVIDVYFRVVYKSNSKECDTASSASGWSGFPTDLYQSDESSKRTFQLCLSFSAHHQTNKSIESMKSPYVDNIENWNAVISKIYEKSQERYTSGSETYERMSTISSAIVGNSLPDAIIEYEWAEIGDWHMLSISLSEDGVICSVDGIERPVLYWTPLGYRSMQDTNGNYKNLYCPFDSKESLSMQFCIGGRFVEEKAHSDILEHNNAYSTANLRSCEEDIVNIYSKLVGGFSGTISDLVTYEGAIDYSQQLAYFKQGPNGDSSIFTNRRLLNMSLPTFVKKEFDQAVNEDSVSNSQDRPTSPNTLKASNILTQNKSKSKRPEPLLLVSSQQSSLVSDLFNIFGGSASILHKGDEDGKNYNPKFSESLKVYQKVTLLESIDKSGGLIIFYPLLLIDKTRQVEVMRIIAAIFLSSQSMLGSFFSSKQDNILLYCLHYNPSITSTECIQEFFEVICPVERSTIKLKIHDRHLKFNKKRPQILSLLFDIAIASHKKPQIARSMMDWLREVCDNIIENCAFVLETLCLPQLLLLLSLWSVSSCDLLLASDKIGINNLPNENMFEDYQGLAERNRLQISCSKVLRILLMGTSGIYQKTISPGINIITPTGFSVDNLLLLLNFIQYSLRTSITEMDNVKVTQSNKVGSDNAIPFFARKQGEPQHKSLNAALAAIDGVLVASDGPLFATISNMIRMAIPKDIWFHFLDLASSIHASVRERALRLLCICMSSPNGKIDPKQLLVFEKIYGFDVLGEHLAFYSADETIVDSLVDMIFWKLGPRPYGVGELNNDLKKSSSDESLKKKFGDNSEILSSRSEDMDISNEYIVPDDSRKTSRLIIDEKNLTNEESSSGVLSFFSWKTTKSLLASDTTSNVGQTQTEKAETLALDESSNDFVNTKQCSDSSFFSIAKDSENAECNEKNLESSIGRNRRSSQKSGSSTRRIKSPISSTLSGLNDDDMSPPRRRRSLPSCLLLDNNVSSHPVSSINAELTIVLPQTLCSLMKVLQTSQRSDIVAKACSSLERALVLSLGGEEKGNMGNLEALTSQKDWLLWMCNCIICFRKRIRYHGDVLNSSNNDQFSDTESVDYRSESGMESEDYRDRSRGADLNGSRSNDLLEEQFTSPILDLIKTITILALEQKPLTAQKYLLDIIRLPIPEATEVQIDIIYDVLDGVESCLLRPIEETFNLLKNFNWFLEQIMEKLELSIDICARVLQTIQAIGYRASPEIRSRFKEIGLQETRNAFVCSCLIEHSDLMDRDKENYDRVALWVEIQPSLYAYLSASEGKQLGDNQVIILILGIFMEFTEDFDSISQVDPHNSSVDVTVLLERLEIILSVLEALIVIIQGCSSVSSEVNKCLIRLFSDLVGDSENNMLNVLAFTVLPATQVTNDNSNHSNTVDKAIGTSLNKSFESIRDGDDSKSWWINWSGQSQNSAIHKSTNFKESGPKIDNPIDIRSFLDWYCSPEQREMYREIKKRMARDLVQAFKQVEKINEKNLQRRSKHIKSLQDKHQKDKSTLTRGVNEFSNKSKVVGNAAYKECNEALNSYISALNDRIGKGKAEIDEYIKVSTIFSDKVEPKREIRCVQSFIKYMEQNVEYSENKKYQAFSQAFEFLTKKNY